MRIFRGLRFRVFSVSSRLARIGVRVKLIKSDISVAITITPANGARIIPTTEVINIIGTNTTTLVRALAATALTTPPAPLAAALLRS